MRSRTDMPSLLQKRAKPFRFVRYLRLLDSRDGEIAHLRRCLPKLEAGNRGVDGWIYGDSRTFSGVVCWTINCRMLLSWLSQRSNGSFYGFQRWSVH